MEAAMPMPMPMVDQDEEGKHSFTNTQSDEMRVPSDDKLIKTMRKEAPTHFILEIESFPFLQEILPGKGLDRYESAEFEASGFIWRMILSLDRDKQRQDGHISLHLKLLGDQNPNRTPSDLDAVLMFFVYDYKEKQYMSIQDGTVKRFEEVNTECGLSRLLSLAEFNDTSKGYLNPQGKSCKFGVEVFVINRAFNGECFCTIDLTESTSNRECYSIPKEDPVIRWHINEFSKLLDSEAVHYSKEQSIRGFNCILHLYPKGVGKAKGQFLSLFLCLDVPYGSKVLVEFNLGIDYPLERFEFDSIKKTGKAWFSGSETGWGFPYFVKLSSLQQKPPGLIDQDWLSVRAEINSISIINKYYPAAWSRA